MPRPPHSPPDDHGTATPPDALPRSPRSRRLAAYGIGLGLVITLFLLGLAVGARPLSLGEVLDGLLRRDQVAVDVVWGNRMPRALLGVLIGAALGLAGAVMQGLTRNPLADPGLLGVNAGASAAVVCGISFWGLTNPTQYLWMALAGAAFASVLVYLLSSGPRSAATPVRMALAGTAITAALSSVVSALMLMDPMAYVKFRFWDIGSLSGRGLDGIGQVGWVVLVGVLLAIAISPMLNALVLGDETAIGLGLNPTQARLIGVLAVTLLCGGATAAVGPIGFVGLAAPHIARAFCGADFRWSIPMSALTGAIVLQSADVAGRVVIWPSELGAGIVTAIIGAPVLIWLVRRGRVSQL